MSILIATPMYGGQCTADYFFSSMALQSAFFNAGVEHDWLRITNESLITRARNVCAREFLKTDFTHLLFIDADIRFDPDDVAKLWNMEKPISVAAYPMKRKDAPLSAWVGGRLVEFPIDINPVPVDYAGTGFMMIERGVLESMKEFAPEYAESATEEPTWGFFLDPVEDGIHLSEDYYFCKRARELGYEISMETSIRLGHVGSWVYGD